MMRAKIEQELRKALKAKDRKRLGVLRMLLSELKVAETSGKEFDELAVVKSYARKLQKTSEEYRRLSLPEEASKVDAELAVVEEFLPPQMESAQIEELVARIIEENNCGPRDLGRVMKVLMSTHGERVDGRLAQEIARRKLAERS